MGKADTLAKQLGSSLAENIGVREEDEPTPPPQVQSSPLDDLTRLRGAGLLPIDQIVIDKAQPRTEHDPEADRELTESIRTRGLLQPIRVRWADSKWVVVVGERRFRASQAAGVDRIPVICVTSTPTPAEVLEDQLCENLQRSNISASDLSKAFQRWLDMTGRTATELASVLNISKSTVSRTLALNQLTPEVQQQVEAGTISPKAAAVLSRVKNPRTQRAIAEKAVAEDLPAESVRQTVRQKEGKLARPVTKSKPLTFKVSRGVRVVVQSTKPISGPDVIAALEQALTQAKAAIGED